MIECFVQILAVFNICLIIAVTTYLTANVMKGHSQFIEDYRSVGNWRQFVHFIKSKAEFISSHTLRLSLIGLLLVNVSQLNTGYLNIKPDYQFIIGSSFYISFAIRLISSDIKKRKMQHTIEELKKDNK